MRSKRSMAVTRRRADQWGRRTFPPVRTEGNCNVKSGCCFSSICQMLLQDLCDVRCCPSITTTDTPCIC
jgi:hypothetical protein